MPYLFNNPFSKPISPLSIGLPVSTFGATEPIPKFGDIQVITNKPIITATSLPTSNFKLPISEAQRSFNTQMKLKNAPTTVTENNPPKENWWTKKTKMQKGLIIGGGVATIGLISFLIYKAVKN